MIGTEIRARVEERWRAAWPQALAAWSSFTMLREPEFVVEGQGASDAGMSGEIAAIRLTDQKVYVNVEGVLRAGVEDHGLAILAHEVGHHVYVPGNATDAGRMTAAMMRALPGLPRETVHLATNLYGDLLINDRLQRRGRADMAAVYRELADRGGGEDASAVWKLYVRTYEHLWRLAPGTLAPSAIPAEMDADAMLLARLVRSCAGQWLRGARRFADVLYRWLVEDQEKKREQDFVRIGLSDTRRACAPPPGPEAGDGVPPGLVEVDPWEEEGDDALDREIDDPLGEGPASGAARAGGRGGGRQSRTPAEYGQLLEGLGLQIPEKERTRRYYRERALPHLIAFPARRVPRAAESLPEGHETWDAAEPVENLDVLGSVMRSPRMIPGVTTLQRVFGETPGFDVARRAMDLDIYVDSSGSMPDPSAQVSYLALAATILVLSALRAGAAVKATLWSHGGSYRTTDGFVRDEKELLGVVTGYLGGGTQFPLEVMSATYAQRRRSDPPAHIVVVSDDGADTMLGDASAGRDGLAVCTQALERARGGATLALNMASLERWSARESLAGAGFRIHAVRDWADLVAFAHAFVRETWDDPMRAEAT